MKLPTLLTPGALREMFATPRGIESPHKRRPLRVVAPAVKDKDGAVIKDELTGRPAGCAACGKTTGEMLVIHRGRRRWTDATGRHSEKVVERRHPGCKPVAVER